MTPVVTYDAIAHVYEISLADGSVAETVKVNEETFVDLDADGNLLAIEVLNPEHAPIDDVLAQYGLDDEAPAVHEAVEHAVPVMISGTTITGAHPISVATTVVGAGYSSSSREINLVTAE